MGKFSLEHKIKERLQGHEVHIDKRELWKGLGIEEEEKDRKTVWFWWFSGLFGIVLIGGLWWYIQGENLDTTRIQKASTVKIDESVEKTGNEQMAEVSTSEKLSAIIDDVKSQNTETSIKTKTTPVNSNIAKSSTYVPSNLEDEISKSISTPINKSYRPKTKNDSQDLNTKLINKGRTGRIASEHISIGELPLVKFDLFYDRTLEDLAVEVNPLIKPIAKVRKFEFELYGGMGSISRELKALNRELENHIALRDSAETSLEQFSFGFSLKYILGGGLYTKVGLGINRWNEKYTYNIVSDTLETTVEIPDVILIDLENNETITYVEGVQKSYNTINWVRYNRLTQIDLPISLGYEHRISRLSIFGEASAIVSLKQVFTGYINTTDGTLTKDPEIFKSTIGLNMGLNIGVGYGFTPRLRGRVSARYYRSLGSVLLPDTMLEQKYSSLGVRVGVGYLF